MQMIGRFLAASHRRSYGTATELKLYTYWRSTAAYRVRIALNLKGIDYESVPVHLVRDGGEQHSDSYRALNPQQLVPTLRDGDVVLTQSLAIIGYLDERYPEPPLLPQDPVLRAHTRALALSIACDIHPLNNLRVLQYLDQPLGVPKEARDVWYCHWIAAGFAAIETRLAGDRGRDRFCVGTTPTLADLCLVPQVYNARRFECNLEPYPNIVEVDAKCREIDAFVQASPGEQPDKE